jgi:short-subunit dehydrogenase
MNIVITGASGAIGQALALEYAGPEITLHLQGRNAEVLESLALQCEQRGAIVQIETLDLFYLNAVADWAQRLCHEGAPDLLILNAGINIHTSSEQPNESVDASHELMLVNLLSAIRLVQGCLPAMRLRGSGQIALISSLAAWRGLPKTPSYSASKAGLKAYGEALRTELTSTGIRVNVVLPGYVESPMSMAMPGPKPCQWTPERAARVIRLGLDRNKGRISFPFFLSMGCHMLALLPDSVSGWLLRKFGYG